MDELRVITEVVNFIGKLMIAAAPVGVIILYRRLKSLESYVDKIARDYDTTRHTHG